MGPFGIPKRWLRPATTLAFLVTLLTAVANGPAHAQFPRVQFWVPNASVEDVAVANGAVYLAGSFTQVGPATGSFVGLDMATGASLQPIPGVDGTVRAMVSDGADGWYVGGFFTSVQGRPRTSLAHIDGAGNVTDWNPGLNGNVFCLLCDPATGVVYVGGSFATVGGQGRIGLAAIDSNGLVTGWNAGFTGATSVYALALNSGMLYAAGSFTSAGGQARNNLAAFDAATAALQSWNPNADATVFALATHETTTTLTVYLGGLFTNVGGAGRIRLAAIDGTTGAATGWNPGASAAVTAIAVAGGTSIFNPLRIYVGGDFQLIGTAPRSRIAQINEAGVPASWNPGADAWVRVLRTAGSLLYVGGDFSSIGGQPFRYLAAVDISTGSATTWDPLVGGRVHALGTTASAVFAGGEFWTVGGVRRNRLAALDLGTGQPTTWNPNADATARALIVGDGAVYAAGNFTSIGGQTRLRLAALDPASGEPTAWNPGADQIVWDLALGSGVVYAGGDFSTIGGQNRSRLAALDVATGLATPWDPGPNGRVSVLCVSGATVYAGGLFGTIGGQSRRQIAALDTGTGLATSWDPDPGDDAGYGFVTIEDIALSGQNVLVGGYFGRMGGRERSRFAAVDSATGMANYWDHHTSDAVYALAVDGPTIYVGGSFLSIDGVSRNGIAAVDAETGILLGWRPGLAAYAFAIAAHQGAIYAGGFFEGRHRSFAVFSNVTTGVAASERAAPPASVVRAAPNPFHSEVALRFALPQAGNLDVTVYDVAGRFVRRLARGPRAAGEHRLRWDGRDDAGRRVATGVYLARVESEGMRLTAKLLRVE